MRSDRGQWRTRSCLAPLAALLCLQGAAAPVLATAASDNDTGLPAGSDLDEDARVNPREVFHSEVTEGRRSYLSSLGNLAFNSPSLLGKAARRAQMSCGTCHVNGASNPRLFIPGLSSRPGTFDTTNALFDPQLDNHVLDAVTIPSLRGARLLAPYGHDGRFATLRDFVHHAIVSEFAGPEPAPQLLDAIVAYIEDIDFLSNPALEASGRLSAAADAAQRRGENLFLRPFPHDASESCASCHVPAAAFVDHRTHDVGSGGSYKTPTLVNANFAGRYFHDGRYGTYAQVVDHFDRIYELSLKAEEKRDLVAYLTAVGDGARPEYRLTGMNVLEDCSQLASVLEVAIPRHDGEVIALAVATVSDQLHGLAEHYPELPGPGAPGARERSMARVAVQALIDALLRVGTNTAAGRLDAAADEYLHYRRLAAGAAPAALAGAERWSLFAPLQRGAHPAVPGTAATVP
jgi:cytochrome c peroxidase